MDIELLLLRTTVFVHTLLSTSHVRTVESKPALTAVLPSLVKMAFDTLAVWLFSTAVDALRFGCGSPAPSTLRRFFRSGPFVAESIGTSSASGIEESQRPIRPSWELVRRWDPAAFAVIDVNGPV